MCATSTLGAVIIGDEILSGKINDANTPVLIDVLSQTGVRLSRVVIVGDDPAEIAGEVKLSAERYDHVVTSGGVGPTHDDRTMEGIAAAFDCALVTHPELERLVREHMGDRVNEAALKMAIVPDGTRLLESGPFPTVAFRNVFILPGIPQIFAAKASSLKQYFDGVPARVHRVYLDCYESEIADALTAVQTACDGVAIGSYPRIDNADYKVMVTVESRDTALADAALERLLSRLPSARVLRTESPEN